MICKVCDGDGHQETVHGSHQIAERIKALEAELAELKSSMEFDCRMKSIVRAEAAEAKVKSLEAQLEAWIKDALPAATLHLQSIARAESAERRLEMAGKVVEAAVRRHDIGCCRPQTGLCELGQALASFDAAGQSEKI